MGFFQGLFFMVGVKAIEVGNWQWSSPETIFGFVLWGLTIWGVKHGINKDSETTHKAYEDGYRDGYKYYESGGRDARFKHGQEKEVK
jgi:hypothetical protein